jgi:hypothetical protein
MRMDGKVKLEAHLWRSETNWRRILCGKPGEGVHIIVWRFEAPSDESDLAGDSMFEGEAWEVL